MIDNFLELAISNPSLTFFVMGLLSSFVVLTRTPKPLQKPQILEAFFSYFILFNIGIGLVNNFVMHTVFAEFVAEFIGWPHSPFQHEVGFASLGFGIVGLLAFRGSFGLRVASIIGPTCFFMGRSGCPYSGYDQKSKFCSGKCRRGLLDRHFFACHWPDSPVSAIQTSTARGVKPMANCPLITNSTY